MERSKQCEFIGIDGLQVLGFNGMLCIFECRLVYIYRW